MDPIETTIDELTLILLYLTREKDRFGNVYSWKGYDFGALNRLSEKGLILQRSLKAKAIGIPEESVPEIKNLLEKYGVESKDGI